jgi:hypothetical protein
MYSVQHEQRHLFVLTRCSCSCTGNTDRPLRLKVVVFFAVDSAGVPSLIRFWELIQDFKEASLEDSSSYT